MFERISNGWQLARQSWEVLKLDKELLLFPLLSGICCLIVLASFGIPILLNIDHLEQWLDEEANPAAQAMMWIGLFLFYFANYFVIVFFNSALVACAIIRFRGGDPTVSDGLSAAVARLPQIALWALASATVGVILRVIESRSEKVGELVAGLMGAAWTIATYFVVPVLVVERANPVEAVKRSLSVIRRTWGEALVAGFSIGFFTFLFSLLAFVPLIVGILAVGSDQPVLGIPLIALGVVGILVVNLINSALESIVLGALYLYASDGEVPQQFRAATLRGAFHAR